MWSEIFDDLRFAASKSSRKELLNTGLAFGGLAVLLGIAGGWLLSVGIEVSDVAMDERISRRGEAAG